LKVRKWVWWPLATGDVGLVRGIFVLSLSLLFFFFFGGGGVEYLSLAPKVDLTGIVPRALTL